MLQYTLVLMLFLACFHLEDANKRSTKVFSVQKVDDGGVQVVDVVKNGEGTHMFQSIDSFGNVHSINAPLNIDTDAIIEARRQTRKNIPPLVVSSVFPSRNVRVVNINGNKFTMGLDTSNYGEDDDEYYDDNEDMPIRRYSKLMNNFMDNVSATYNQGFSTEDGIPEHIFIHYYAGKVVTPTVIHFSQRDATKCPRVGFCLKPSRSMCIAGNTACVVPLRKTTPCEPIYNNGNLPCLSTSIFNEDSKEEPIIVPCITTLVQIDKRKKYCVIIVDVPTHIRQTMDRVNQRVKNQLANAQMAIQHGLEAGQQGLMRGMESLKRALSGIHL